MGPQARPEYSFIRQKRKGEKNCMKWALEEHHLWGRGGRAGLTGKKCSSDGSWLIC